MNDTTPISTPVSTCQKYRNKNATGWLLDVAKLAQVFIDLTPIEP